MGFEQLNVQAGLKAAAKQLLLLVGIMLQFVLLVLAMILARYTAMAFVVLARHCITQYGDVLFGAAVDVINGDLFSWCLSWAVLGNYKHAALTVLAYVAVLFALRL